MIYKGLNRIGMIGDIKTKGGGEIAEVYGGINEASPIYYKSRTITGQTPLSYKALSKPLSDYLISGNTTQNGTPTPSDPVDVAGCGEKTANLFDLTDYTSGYTIAGNGEIIENSNYSLSGYIFCTAGTYTLSGKNTYSTTADIANRAILYDENKENPVLVLGAKGSKPVDFEYTFQILESGFLVFSFRVTDINIMLNSGATAIPYEPYGYKLPLTVNGTEYPIYLGQVPTTRRIKKLVFDGTETLHVYDRNGYVAINDGLQQTLAPYCDILPGTTLPSAESPDSVKQLMTNIGEISCAILFKVSTGFSSIDAFRAWIEENTPTVWYVLAEPETSIVNEPLMKIGEYADTISMAQAGVTIPTVAGANTLTVDTTVQPSEVSITGNIKEVQGT